jgi:hypothetical protein
MQFFWFCLILAGNVILWKLYAKVIYLLVYVQRETKKVWGLQLFHFSSGMRRKREENDLSIGLPIFPFMLQPLAHYTLLFLFYCNENLHLPIL